jgi:hypothetical protein
VGSKQHHANQTKNIRRGEKMSEFRKLKSLKFLYEINEDGVLRNVKSKKIVHGYCEKNGYIRVKIENKCLGHTIRTTIHRLVAEAFIPNPENKPEVNHIDSVRHHNNVNNLEWVTHSENMKHSYNKGINTEGITKYRESERERVTNGSETFVSISSAAEWLASCGRAKNKTSAIAGISAVIRNRRKTFGGYKWSVV